MQELPDVQLLAAFAGRGDEAAFREIVTRYADLVYSAALRQVESSTAAADIAQSVFTDLARKAGTVARAGNEPLASLAGWLHRATRYAALNHLRDARRRLTNERQAMEQLLTNSESAADWEQIRPVLDEALDSLADEDREALLLRYFKNQDFRAVGLALGVSDDAAQKRVSRAVDRLREHFSKRNVAIGAGGLVVLISANAIQAAPAGLAAVISTAALAATAVAASTTTAIALTKTIAMTTLQKAFVAVTITVLAGAGIYEARQAAQLREQNQELEQQQVALADQVRQLQQGQVNDTNGLRKHLADNSAAQSAEKLAELLKLRGQVGVLREKLEAQSNSPAKAIASLLNDPAKKELARIDLQKALNARYAAFVAAANLPPDTVDKLFSLITQNELSKKDRLASLVLGDMDAAAALQDRDNAKQDEMQQIQALLGPDLAAQFTGFDRSYDASAAVTAINGQMGSIPLNADQSSRLQALISAQPEVPVDEVDLFRSQASLDALYQQQFDRAQNLLQQADTFLTPDQASALGTINSNYWSEAQAKLTLNRQLINSTLGRGN